MDKNKASDKNPAMERQQIITWHTLEERLPKKFIDVLVTFSAQLEDSDYQHALGIATYWPDKTWLIDGLNPEESNTATIHAWADIEPYWGKAESDEGEKMKVERLQEIETTSFQIGDRIHVGHYTATCQEIAPKGALFLLDQYLDKAYPMNRRNTNKGGYPESDLRKALQRDEVLGIFAGIHDYMVPFDNGDLLRLPFAGEMFGDNLPGWVKPDGHEQWPLMKDAHNRAASRCGESGWGWLANTVRDTSTNFCIVDHYGAVCYWDASNVFGVRPVFVLK